jgi:hypothetical protein
MPAASNPAQRGSVLKGSTVAAGERDRAVKGANLEYDSLNRTAAARHPVSSRCLPWPRVKDRVSGVEILMRSLCTRTSGRLTP